MAASATVAAMPISRRFVIQFTTSLLAIGFAALIVIVTMTVWLGERARWSFDDITQARDIRIAAVEMRNAVRTAESSQRGFIMTGNEIYLAPYDSARTQAQWHLDTLRRFLGHDAQTGALLQRLSVVLDDKLKEMDESIALRNERREADALAIIRTNRGKALMDEINVFLSGIIQSADDRLTTGVALFYFPYQKNLLIGKCCCEM